MRSGLNAEIEDRAAAEGRRAPFNSSDASLTHSRSPARSPALRRFENTIDDVDAVGADAEEEELSGSTPSLSSPSSSSSPSFDLVDAEEQLKQYHEKYSRASSALSKAQRARTVAERRLSLCAVSLSSTSAAHVSGQQHLRALHDVGTVIYGGLTRIFYGRDVSGGVLDTWTGINGVLQGLFPLGRRGDDGEPGGVGRQPPPPQEAQQQPQQQPQQQLQQQQQPTTGISYHMDSLQSVVQAATGPLVSVSKALFMSTSAALVGTSSLFRFGASLFQFGMQSLIFLSLLFALLSAEEDPLTSLITSMPFPPAARDKAAIALNKSLGGVFVTLIKLCVIHGLFTWWVVAGPVVAPAHAPAPAHALTHACRSLPPCARVTFTFFDAPLVYLTSTLAAAFSIVPFVPSWLVAIPSATALAVQGRIISSIVLLGLHFAAYSFGDTEILNEAGTGGQPYLMSLSVFGGLYAVPANPFLGGGY